MFKVRKMCKTVVKQGGPKQAQFLAISLLQSVCFDRLKNGARDHLNVVSHRLIRVVE